MNRTTAVFLAFTLATAAAIACICIPSPASPALLPEKPTKAPTEALTVTPTEAPTVTPTKAPSQDKVEWRYCDRAWVSNISLAGAETGWAMVDCYHDVGVRTSSTGYLYRLVDVG